MLGWWLSMRGICSRRWVECGWMWVCGCLFGEEREVVTGTCW